MAGLNAVVSRQPGRVLTTWNLLNSAAVFEDSRVDRVPLSSVTDLAALIDIYCLYDEAALVGRGTETTIAQRDLHDALIEADFVKYVASSDDRVIPTWTKHLALFTEDRLDELSQVSQDRYSGGAWFSALFNHIAQTGHADEYAGREYAEKLLHGALRSSILNLGGDPDVLDDTDPVLSTPAARRALVSELVREGSTWSRMHTFLLRTFLYLAVADVHELPFVPDSTRQHIVENAVVRAEEFFRSLAQQLQLTLSRTVETSVPGGSIYRDASPLSAIVFERAKANRSRIVPEMVSLRNELTPLREQLRRLEHDRFFGTADDAKDAQAKWDNALKEVEHSFGPRPRLWSWRGAAKLSEELGDAIDQPTSFASWSKALAGLPIELVSRLIRRRTFVGLHRLRRELPAAGTLSVTIGRLFSPR